MTSHQLVIKRIYDDPAPEDGYRVLVDRLWPRGVSKERAHLDVWMKGVAPSPDLRTQWHHDPAHFDEFAHDYRNELASNPGLDELRDAVHEHPRVTLLYAAKDPHNNHALVLLSYLRDNA